MLLVALVPLAFGAQVVLAVRAAGRVLPLLAAEVAAGFVLPVVARALM